MSSRSLITVWLTSELSKDDPQSSRSRDDSLKNNPGCIPKSFVRQDGLHTLTEENSEPKIRKLSSKLQTSRTTCSKIGKVKRPTWFVPTSTERY